MKIGVFDSGIGGLNVLSELLKKYPNNQYIYLGDTLNLPYGNKSHDELLELSMNNINFLISKDVDMIIIACGTVSSNCYLELIDKYQIPIYDIITPTINYLKTIKGRIGVIATNRTIESHIFKINDNVLELATPEFVPIIENNVIDDNIDLINEKINELGNINYLVLGCTHYPLIKDVIKKDVNFIDMGKCLVDTINLTNIGDRKIDLYFTKIDDTLKENIKKIIKDKYEVFEK